MSWTDPALVQKLEADGTDVCRIGAGPGWRAERFGPGVIISHEAGDLPSGLLEQVQDWLVRAGVSIARIYARHLVVGPGRTDIPRLVYGEEPSDHKAVVSESGLRYEVDFLAGYSCGLFLDQRINRLHLRSLAPTRVLNTFAYTCAFSVAAAAVGANTLSLDLARAALDRGKRNFALNDFPLEGHRFIADDVLDVLPRLARRGEKFDAIILDPPTFSRGRSGRTFQVERDFGDLLAVALQCAAPGASLLLSTNCSTLNARRFGALAEPLAPGASFFTAPLPEDVRGAGASTTLWMTLR